MTNKTIHDIDKDVAVLQNEVKTQFREVFFRIKRLEYLLIGSSAFIITLLLKLVMEK